MNDETNANIEEFLESSDGDDVFNDWLCEHDVTIKFKSILQNPSDTLDNFFLLETFKASLYTYVISCYPDIEVRNKGEVGDYEAYRNDDMQSRYAEER